MKKIVIAILAASIGLTAASPSFAYEARGNDRSQPTAHYQSDGRDNHDRDDHKAAKKEEKTYHRFVKGERFDAKRTNHYKELDHSKYRALKAPPKGYHWVRAGDDALLISLKTGVVDIVVSNLF